MIQSSTLQFLKALKKNNNKPWFDQHRSAYEASRADFIQFVQQLIDRHGKKDAGISTLSARDCLFRINRDIRFSKDKSPYKTNFGASINQGGKQSMTTAGYYFHLEPGQSFTGGGIWMPPADALRKVRQEIDYNYKDFLRILRSRSFQSVYGNLAQDAEYKLSRVPKGYEADNPAAEYLKLKSFIASITLPDAALTGKDLVKTTCASFEALKPLIYFINQAIAD